MSPIILLSGSANSRCKAVQHYDINENGLVGIAVDPDFETNRYVCVFAAVSSSEQRIIRFTDRDNCGRRILPRRGL